VLVRSSLRATRDSVRLADTSEPIVESIRANAIEQRWHGARCKDRSFELEERFLYAIESNKKDRDDQKDSCGDLSFFPTCLSSPAFYTLVCQQYYTQIQIVLNNYLVKK
jgi:hypothetical protein